MFIVSVTKTMAVCTQVGRLTEGLIGAKVFFKFSEEWAYLKKHVYFSDGVINSAVIDPENPCVIPRDVLGTKYRKVRVGVKGVSDDGRVTIPTVWADLGVVMDSASESNKAVDDIEDRPLWQQAIAKTQEALDAVDTVLDAVESGALIGPQGPPGPQGEPGNDGTSVTVTSVSESTADEGDNVVTFSDGKTVTIKNGSKGTAGADGKTPVKGTDYWTAADKSEMVSDVLAALPETGGGAQSDWNASEGEPGHVLNRTHYEEVTEVEGDTLTWDGNTDGRVTTGDGDEGLVVKVSDAVPTIGDFVNGVSIILNDGSVYNETYETIRSGYEESGILSSDHWIISPADDFNFADYLFFPEAGVYFIAGDERAASFTLPGYTGFVSKQTVVKTIDPKFLPEALQFGETTVMGDTLTWDGNTEGLVSVMLDEDLGFFHVSNATPAVSEMKNGVTEKTSDGSIHIVEFEEEIKNSYDNMGIVNTEAYIVCYSDNFACEAMGITFPKAGVYFISGYGIYTSSITIPGYTGFETTTVKPLDEKYMPILTSPGGKKFKLSVDDSGTITAAEV